MLILPSATPHVAPGDGLDPRRPAREVALGNDSVSPSAAAYGNGTDASPNASGSLGLDARLPAALPLVVVAANGLCGAARP